MEERRNEILKELDRKGRVKVTDLSKEFGCSEVTIRNDIKAMDIEGLLKRTHGGAVKVETETERKYSAETIYRNVTQKKQIAEAAYEFLDDRDTIIIDDASTSFYLAQEIKNHPEKRIAVVTNSLIAGNELAGVGHVELSIAPPQMEVKKAIMKAAEKVYVLADRSTFGGGYRSVICPTNEVDKIITDDGVSKEDIQKAKELDIPLVIA